jgi:hypothetical protein
MICSGVSRFLLISLLGSAGLICHYIWMNYFFSERYAIIHPMIRIALYKLVGFGINIGKKVYGKRLRTFAVGVAAKPGL